MSEQRKELVAELLKELSAKQRTILALYYSESLTFLDISKRLRISESGVMRAHARALDLIRAKASLLGITAKDVL